MDALLVPRGIDPGTRQASVFGIGISFIVFIFIVICLRMYVRMALIKAVGVDDILMVIGAVLTFALSVGSMLAAYYGVGKHVDQIKPEETVAMLQSVYSTRIIYVVALMFVKMSLLWFFLRLDQRRSMRWAVYVLMFFVLGLSIPSAFILALSCLPPSKFWDITGTAPGKCLQPGPQQQFYDANGILNIITDVFIFIAPMPMLWDVQITARKKAALFGVFGLGVFSIAAGCVRFYYVQLLSDNDDMYYHLADSLNWCALESYVAIFCGSAPALSVLVKQFLPRIFGTSHPGRSNSRSHQLGDMASRSKTKTKETWHAPKGSGRHHTSKSGSQEAMVRQDKDGVVVTTELRLDVTQRDSDENMPSSGPYDRQHRRPGQM